MNWRKLAAGKKGERARRGKKGRPEPVWIWSHRWRSGKWLCCGCGRVDYRNLTPPPIIIRFGRFERKSGPFDRPKSYFMHSAYNFQMKYYRICAAAVFFFLFFFQLICQSTGWLCVATTKPWPELATDHYIESVRRGAGRERESMCLWARAGLPHSNCYIAKVNLCDLYRSTCEQWSDHEMVELVVVLPPRHMSCCVLYDFRPMPMERRDDVCTHTHTHMPDRTDIDSYDEEQFCWPNAHR